MIPVLCLHLTVSGVLTLLRRLWKSSFVASKTGERLCEETFAKIPQKAVVHGATQKSHDLQWKEGLLTCHHFLQNERKECAQIYLDPTRDCWQKRLENSDAQLSRNPDSWLCLNKVFLIWIYKVFKILVHHNETSLASSTVLLLTQVHM